MSELLTIAVVVLSVALAASLVLLLRLQGQLRPASSEFAVPATPPETGPPTASPPAEISPLALAPALGELLAPDDVFMASVPGEPDLAIVQGSPEALRAVGKFEVIGAVPHEMLRSAVGTDALVRAGIALGEGAGTLVRLTPASAAKFRELAKMKDASGAFMGVLKRSNGQFAHVLRFTPATGLVALSGISSGLAAIAIQAQLTSIERAIADVGVDVRRVLKTMALDAAAESAAITSMLGETYRAATSAGKLTEAMWEQVAPLVFLVQKREEYVDRRLVMLIDELAHQSGLKEKRRWLERNGQDLQDSFDAVQHHGRLTAQMAALRLWRLILVEDPSTPFYVQQLREMVPARALTVNRLGQELDDPLAETGRTRGVQPFVSPWDTRALASLSSRIRGDLARSTAVSLPAPGKPDTPASLPDHSGTIVNRASYYQMLWRFLIAHIAASFPKFDCPPPGADPDMDFALPGCKAKVSCPPPDWPERGFAVTLLFQDEDDPRFYTYAANNEQRLHAAVGAEFRWGDRLAATRIGASRSLQDAVTETASVMGSLSRILGELAAEQSSSAEKDRDSAVV